MKLNDFSFDVCQCLSLDEQQPVKIDAFYKLCRCYESFGQFKKGHFYLQGIGKVVQGNIVKTFVGSFIERNFEEVPNGIFGDYQTAQDVWRIAYKTEFFYFVVGTDGQNRLIPSWWFNVEKVLESVSNHRGFRGKTWEWCEVETKATNLDPKTKFMAWGFMDSLGLFKVFNIEDGEWYEPSEIMSVKDITVGNYTLGQWQLVVEKGIIERKDVNKHLR